MTTRKMNARNPYRSVSEINQQRREAQRNICRNQCTICQVAMMSKRTMKMIKVRAVARLKDQEVEKEEAI